MHRGLLDSQVCPTNLATFHLPDPCDPRKVSCRSSAQPPHLRLFKHLNFPHSGLSSLLACMNGLQSKSHQISCKDFGWARCMRNLRSSLGRTSITESIVPCYCFLLPLATASFTSCYCFLYPCYCFLYLLLLLPLPLATASFTSCYCFLYLLLLLPLPLLLLPLPLATASFTLATASFTPCYCFLYVRCCIRVSKSSQLLSVHKELRQTFLFCLVLIHRFVLFSTKWSLQSSKQKVTVLAFGIGEVC